MKNNYQELFALVEAELDKSMTFNINEKQAQKIIMQAMSYSLLAGGKRLRGVLLLECARLCGCNLQLAAPFAAAIEIIHTYSLVHDDMPEMDNDDFRRNKPACHIKFGSDIALLAGDALQAYAFEYITTNSRLDSAKTLKAIAILSKAAGFSGMVGGQVIDKQSEKKSIKLEELLLLHKLKTGALISAACEIGCALGDCSDEQQAEIVKYSEHIGLAFQIKDDLLDIQSAFKNSLGKPANSDAASQKSTFLSVLGIKKSEEYLAKEIEKAVRAACKVPNNELLVWICEYILKRNN